MDKSRRKKIPIRQFEHQVRRCFLGGYKWKDRKLKTNEFMTYHFMEEIFGDDYKGMILFFDRNSYSMDTESLVRECVESALQDKLLLPEEVEDDRDNDADVI